MKELEESGVIQIERRFKRCASTGKIEKTSNKYIIPERANLALPTAKTARKTGEGDANLAHKQYYPFNNTNKHPGGIQKEVSIKEIQALIEATEEEGV